MKDVQRMARDVDVEAVEITRGKYLDLYSQMASMEEFFDVLAFAAETMRCYVADQSDMIRQQDVTIQNQAKAIKSLQSKNGSRR